ncbi:MAG: SUF system NifU family Fe-S cluster assembly protein [Candidatus Thermoplasmatota archaeon]|jgi:nitrogen fixation NifU-like protein|nr:SUF system NifU family Fe-S cluster assembly protein [Candidatus Thermoplasmatota archaeon]MCL6089977.1 SUF system NifU family Fe-S cluster assembly protein [Candidatus Thermoplasmatota archaeon]MDA8143149.1 SUF system NifU family Fe-S cluster assembly protein [Thermoplasmatales archaeon]
MTDADLNSEILLDHYRNPHHHGQIENPSAKQLEYNPVCGDTIQITVRIENDRITDIKFIGRGCSVSQGTASMLTDHVLGLSLEEVKKISQEDLLDMLGINLGPSREKCALLSLNTIKKCISQYENKSRS